MERDPCKPLRLAFFHNFNSHAHVERDGLLLNQRRHQPISTHTLTWSVTGLKNGYVALGIISTHTLTWSVTLLGLFKLFLILISTHTLTWSVTEAVAKYETALSISTHTLTWSVTK